MSANSMTTIDDTAAVIAAIKTVMGVYDDAQAQIAAGKDDQYGSRAMEVANAQREFPQHIAALLAHVDALTTALRPFAAMGYANDDPDLEEVNYDSMGINSWAVLFCADYYRARKFFRDEDLEQFNRDQVYKAYPDDDEDGGAA